jgi:hypothetical protein
MNSENENENEKSIYNYNMIFNKVNNVNSEEDTEFDTNIISDINLQNFDVKRYEYYKNLIYIYKKDPDTLYNLLKKYYNIKNLKKKEKNIIKYISNYARLLKENGFLEKSDKKDSYKYNNLIKGLLGDVKKLDHTSNRDELDGKSKLGGSYILGGTDESSQSSVEELNIKMEELEKIIKMLNKIELEIEKQDELINKEDGTRVSNILNKTLNKTIKPAIDIIKKIKDIHGKVQNTLNKTVKPTIDIATKILKRKVGGVSNDDLKTKYLDMQKYKKLKDTDLNELKVLKENSPLFEDDTNDIGKISLDIDNYYSKNKDKRDDEDIIRKINTFENDPKNPLEELELKFDDRIIFIIATFFIRYITVIMVQWCIDINIIKTFYEGFIYYAVIYILIFWFIVLFINIDNSFDVKYMNFNGIMNSIRTLFYYFYMGTNGVSRLLIHTSLILILIIIPIILNIKNKTEFNDDEHNEMIRILNYEERKQLSKSLSLFTMFIWLFTSIIATKF